MIYCLVSPLTDLSAEPAISVLQAVSTFLEMPLSELPLLINDQAPEGSVFVAADQSDELSRFFAFFLRDSQPTTERQP